MYILYALSQTIIVTLLFKCIIYTATVRTIDSIIKSILSIKCSIIYLYLTAMQGYERQKSSQVSKCRTQQQALLSHFSSKTAATNFAICLLNTVIIPTVVISIEITTFQNVYAMTCKCASL